MPSTPFFQGNSTATDAVTFLLLLPTVEAAEFLYSAVDWSKPVECQQ